MGRGGRIYHDAEPQKEESEVDRERDTKGEDDDSSARINKCRVKNADGRRKRSRSEEKGEERVHRVHPGLYYYTDFGLFGSWWGLMG